MESVRQKKVAELIKTQLSEILQHKGWYTVYGTLVTIVNTTVTPDLLEAKIYLSVLNTANKDAILSHFETNNKEIRKSLAQKIGKQVRRIPELRFYLDDTLDEVFKLESLFQKIKSQDQND